jgi:hypothetical protein
VVVATAYVVLHAFDIVASVHGLQHHQIKLSDYSPARTPQLRNVVRYFSTYVLLIWRGLRPARKLKRSLDQSSNIYRHVSLILAIYLFSAMFSYADLPSSGCSQTHTEGEKGHSLNLSG